ncbi:MAG: nucleoside deaminase [Parcubacteria group bacterium]
MTDKDFLKLAIEQAKNSVSQGGFPAGAVVVKGGEVISEGVSLGFKLNDLTSHAEITAVRKACEKLQTTDLTGATLYASLTPCLMCFSAANWASISRIVFGCRKTDEMVSKGYYEGVTDITKINQENSKKIELVYLPDFEEEILRVITEWEKNR